MSSKFVKKQDFKLKKLDRFMYMRNMDSLLNKEGLIKYTVEVNIYYQEHKERFVLRKGKIYPLSREEREEVQEFIKEQLRKGYIRPSKSP